MWCLLFMIYLWPFVVSWTNLLAPNWSTLWIQIIPFYTFVWLIAEWVFTTDWMNEWMNEYVQYILHSLSRGLPIYVTMSVNVCQSQWVNDLIFLWTLLFTPKIECFVHECYPLLFSICFWPRPFPQYTFSHFFYYTVQFVLLLCWFVAIIYGASDPVDCLHGPSPLISTCWIKLNFISHHIINSVLIFTTSMSLWWFAMLWLREGHWHECDSIAFAV